ncbi:MAG TPA: PhnD/SsuA/transferrin family substrate-binding protein [Candidatus Binatia bacterium]|nr:PhnD/SsuA/transferrin family substrate-binding protein [Candidatus Binatia bacterium]
MRRVAIIALACLLLGVPARAHAAHPKLFFFSPDFSPGNLSVLTQAVDAYLREAGTETRFQAFVRFEDFRREVAAQRPDFIVVPDWAATPACVGSELVPLARPIRGGESFGRKALIARAGIRSLAELRNASIAATVPPGGSPPGSGLDRIRREQPGIRIIQVPKEIDALLAVAFGQVDAAYVSTRQFDMFAGVNPKLGTELKEIGYAEAMPFPLIYATANADADEITQLRNAIAEVSTSGTGKRLVGLLGYDGWVVVDEASTEPSGSEPVPALCTPIEESAR